MITGKEFKQKLIQESFIFILKCNLYLYLIMSGPTVLKGKLPAKQGSLAMNK